jgi:hypothetical protein
MQEEPRRNLEEAWRRLQEKERREEEKRAAIATMRKQAEENQRRREAEAEERRRRQQEARRLEARRKLEGEKETKRGQWLDAGGDEQSFERAWPLLEQQFLMSRLLTDSERERRADTAHYERSPGSWQWTRGSALFAGVGEDGAYLTDHIARQASRPQSGSLIIVQRRPDLRMSERPGGSDRRRPSPAA